MSCKDTKRLDFSLTDRAHDVQHSIEGTATAGWEATDFKFEQPAFPLRIIKHFK